MALVLVRTSHEANEQVERYADRTRRRRLGCCGHIRGSSFSGFGRLGVELFFGGQRCLGCLALRTCSGGALFDSGSGGSGGRSSRSFALIQLGDHVLKCRLDERPHGVKQCDLRWDGLAVVPGALDVATRAQRLHSGLQLAFDVVEGAERCFCVERGVRAVRQRRVILQHEHVDGHQSTRVRSLALNGQRDRLELLERIELLHLAEATPGEGKSE